MVDISDQRCSDGSFGGWCPGSCTGHFQYVLPSGYKAASMTIGSTYGGSCQGHIHLVHPGENAVRVWPFLVLLCITLCLPVFYVCTGAQTAPQPIFSPVLQVLVSDRRRSSCSTTMETPCRSRKLPLVLSSCMSLHSCPWRASCFGTWPSSVV